MAANLPSPREVLDRVPGHFLPEKAGDARATVHLELTGVNAGQWTLQVAGGRCEVLDGFQGTPDLALQADGGDYVQIMQGTLNPLAAFMQGRVKFNGDLMLLLRMQGWFRLPDGITLPNGFGR